MKIHKNIEIIPDYKLQYDILQDSTLFIDFSAIN